MSSHDLLMENVMVPDSITSVVGWRAWMWHHGLRSCTVDFQWTPGTAMRASCTGVVNLLAAHPGLILNNADIWAPGLSCSCGLYAAKDIDRVRPYLSSPPSQASCDCPSCIRARSAIHILGRVALWGRVEVYSDGWRGEYAYPQSFYVPDEKLAEMKSALADFGVPVMPMSELRISAPIPVESPSGPSLTFKLMVELRSPKKKSRWRFVDRTFWLVALALYVYLVVVVAGEYALGLSDGAGPIILTVINVGGIGWSFWRAREAFA